MARPPVDHVDGRLHSLGAEPVQGFLAGVSTIGACDRRTGLGVGAGRGVGVEILSRMSWSTACSLVISRVICSWPAESWSKLRVIYSRLMALAAMLTASPSMLRRTAWRSTDIALSEAAGAIVSLAASP